MVRAIKNYSVYNDDDGSYIEEGENLYKITYRDSGKEITLKDVDVESITEETIELELEDFELVVIPIKDIVSWE